MEKKIKLPVYETLGLIMANHTIKSKRPNENSNIVFNEDLILFQYLLNKNLKQRFGDKAKEFNFLVELTFETKEEKDGSTQNYPYSDFIKTSFLLPKNTNGLPPLYYVRKFYEYNAKKKLSKLASGDLEKFIMEQINERIASTYQKPENREKARYAYWCDNAILDEEYYNETGRHRYKDSFVNHAREIYGRDVNYVCRPIAEALNEDINDVFRDVMVPTLAQFEELEYLYSNTLLIKSMITYEKWRKLGENIRLPEDVRNKYSQMFNSKISAVENYLENNSEKNK